MTNRNQTLPVRQIRGKKLTLVLAAGSLLMTSSCARLSQEEDASLSDDSIRQYVDEWRQVKPSIERLAALEGDLSYLLAEVSTMTDIPETPGLALLEGFPEPSPSGIAVPYVEPLHTLDAKVKSPEPNETANTSTVVDEPNTSSVANEPDTGISDAKESVTNIAASESVTIDSASDSTTNTAAEDASPGVDSLGTTVPSAAEDVPALAADATAPSMEDSERDSAPITSCPAQYAEQLRKSIAISYFPRAQPATSSAGELHQVDQHLPMLLSANLKTRHGIQIRTEIPNTIYSAKHQGEYSAAAQAKALARQHKSQFLITGEIRDMSLVSPELAYAQGPYNNLVKGVTNLINRNGLNTQSRMFEFQMQVRHGPSGELLLDETYQTMGNWDAIKTSNIGFGSARFWQTDYGQQVQHLVAHASDKLAATLACQPFAALADVSPGTRQVVVHGGANNGLQAGDTLAIYRVVQHPIPGEYQRYHSSMIRTDANVSLVNVYPSHSVAQSTQELPQTESFLVVEP